MRRVEMVEADQEARPIGVMQGADLGNQLLRRGALFVGMHHDGRPMRVIGADEVHGMPLCTLKPHPDVGLDVFHDVANVKRAIGVRQRGGNKKGTRHRGVCVAAAIGGFLARQTIENSRRIVPSAHVCRREEHGDSDKIDDDSLTGSPA